MLRSSLHMAKNLPKFGIADSLKIRSGFSAFQKCKNSSAFSSTSLRCQEDEPHTFRQSGNRLFDGQTVLPPEGENKTEDQLRSEEVIKLVDQHIINKSHGRLFAVLFIDEKQVKVAAGDLVLVVNDFGCDIGAQIVLDKVVMVGSRDFSLLGRPVLPRDLVEVHATVVDKNLSKTKVTLVSKSRITRHKMLFEKPKEMTLRINEIKLLCPIEEAKDRSGFEMKVQHSPLDIEN